MCQMSSIYEMSKKESNETELHIQLEAFLTNMFLCKSLVDNALLGVAKITDMLLY